MDKIIYISDTGKVIGGGEYSLFYLLKGIKDKCHPLVLSPSTGSFTEMLQKEGIDYKIYPQKFFFKQLIYITGLIKKEEPSLIHVNSFGSFVILFAFIAKLMGVKFVWHIRVRKSIMFFDYLLGILSTKIIVISDYVAKRVRKPMLNNKVVRVWNGVDIESYTASNDDQQKKSFLVGSMGRYCDWKSYESLIESAAFINKSYDKNVRFVIYGFLYEEENSYLKKLRSLIAKHGLEDSFILLGETSDVAEKLKEMDVFVLPSKGEPFGRVVIEAMACALPVIAFDEGGVKDIIVDGKTGYLVKNRDARIMGERIVALLDSSNLRKEMGDLGRLRVEKYFTIKSYVEGVLSVYKEIGFLIKCPVCGAELGQYIEDQYDNKVIKCRKCHLVYVYPQPDQEFLFNHYNQTYYDPWVGDQKEDRKKMWIRRLHRIKSIMNAGKLLDVGCGSAAFIKEAKKNGFDVAGTEVFDDNVKSLRAGGLQVYNGDLADLEIKDKKFDLITMWHVLEHMPDPKKNLQKVYDLLGDSGYLIVAVPNLKDYLYQLVYFLKFFKKRKLFTPYDRELHLMHFSPSVLKEILVDLNFEILSVEPDKEKVIWYQKFIDNAAYLLYRLFGVIWGMSFQIIARKKCDL